MVCCCCLSGVIIASVVVLIIAYLAYMGVFRKIQIKKTKFGPCSLLVTDYQGVYYKIGDAFTKSDLLTKDIFKKSICCGLYYDDPSSLDKNQFPRASIALIVDPSEL